MGVHIGDLEEIRFAGRDEQAARKLWDSLPPIYRQCAFAYTDFWAAYDFVGEVNKRRVFANAIREQTSSLN